MRVVRTVLLGLLFIGGVFLCSANVQPVELVLLPELPLEGWPARHSISIPLFLLVLGSLIAGVLIGGLGALIQHVRLRTGLRRARKENRRQGEELNGAREKLALMSAELEQARREIAQLETRSSALPANEPESSATQASSPGAPPSDSGVFVDSEAEDEPR